MGFKKRFEKPDPCREIERNFRAFQMASKLPAEINCASLPQGAARGSWRIFG
jgi:hypothetical protein